MYLTQIPVVTGGDYQQHQNIRQFFPGDQKVLFQQSDSSLTILSSEKPVGLQSQEIDISSLAVVGERYSFTIRLNPTKRDIKTHKMVALENDLVKPWIAKQLSKAGVAVKFQYIKEGVRRSMKQGKTISLVSVLCFGFLTVKDAGMFREVLENGLGHGKGLGFGMLNIFSN